LLGGCSKEHDPAKLEKHNVLFVTLDTTRADKLGCYGWARARTPALDWLAARGTLFEQAIAPVPLTLPSHCSMMTGLYPREHGVRDNGGERLGKQATLASLFKQRGYRTGGFVASFVLDSEFGIDQGFDAYNDDMGGRKAGENPLEAQQPGNVVTDRALEWLNKSGDQPFFCWVHYYDAHDPYEPPEGFRFPDLHPYGGELAFIDSQMKRLFDWLAEKKLVESTLVVVVGDHGESFAEHGESGHTNFTYDTNLHVPLVFAHPGVIPAGKRVGAMVELVDLYPTILELFGWDAPHSLMSSSLAAAFVDGKVEDREVYSETLYVFNQYEWAEQRSLTTRQWKYISSVKPELYNRVADPGETKNLLLDEPRVASDMADTLRQKWESMVPGTAEKANLSPEAIKKLRDLGYLGGTATDPKSEQFLTAGLPDPKDKLDVIKLNQMGRLLVQQARTPKDFQMAIPLLRDLVRMAPKSVQFHFMYASCLVNARRPDEAIVVLDHAIKDLGAQKSQMFQLKADALKQLGRWPEALAEYEAALALDPESALAHDSYAGALADVGRTEEAIEHARKAIAIDPQSPVGHARLCTVLTEPVELRKATDSFAAVVGNTADDAPWRWRLAQVLGRGGRMDEAMGQLKKSIELNPEFAPARMGLGGLYLERKEFAAAREMFQKVAELEGHEAEGLYHLGVAWDVEGRPDEAAKMYERAIEKDPTYIEAIVELMMHHRRAGRLADSIRVLSNGAESNPNSPLILSALGQILATTAVDSLRNCERAAPLLERASQLAHGRDPLILANLAAAYACLGRFDEAIGVVEQAMKLDDGSQRQRLEQQLELHGRGQPYVDVRLK
jgi:arylsulfatase A-like enzyme/tetratricopeptide (TPR) repeat protein